MPLACPTPGGEPRSLTCISNHGPSPDLNAQNKQYGVPAVSLDGYIGGCGCHPYVGAMRHKGYRVYTPDWGDQKLTVDGCGRLIKEISYRGGGYIGANNALINELSRIHHPSPPQLKPTQNPTTYHDDWMIKDPEEFIDIFHSKYPLNSLIPESDHRGPLY